MPNDQLVYQDLGPDRILDAVESTGLHCNGHLHALNSYENRVYQIGVEEGGYIVAKFYRPGRWSDEAIREEHAFALELAGHEIPVVPPLRDTHGETLHHHEGFRFAIYPRRGGRWPELDNPDNLVWLGRFIGRIHAVGAVRPFVHRPSLARARQSGQPRVARPLHRPYPLGKHKTTKNTPADAQHRTRRRRIVSL